MTSEKLRAGEPFPSIETPALGGGKLKLGFAEGAPWTALFVYRGKHCPMCTRYFKELAPLVDAFEKIGVAIQAVSADTEEKAKAHAGDEMQLAFPVGYDLSIAQMNELGLYVSEPRSPEETDRPFAEPGLFVVNEQGCLHVVDIANNPFLRPELPILLRGLTWIKDPANNYPIRGARAAA